MIIISAVLHFFYNIYNKTQFNNTYTRAYALFRSF